MTYKFIFIKFFLEWGGVYTYRMPDIRLPVAALGYHPTGKRDAGRPVSYTHLDVYKRQE